MVFYSDTFIDMKEVYLIQVVSEVGLLLPFLFKKKNSPWTVINRHNLFWGGYYSFSYKGDMHERVSDRVLYDILIQAGRVVDLYIPRDKETDLRLQNANLQRLQTMPSSFSLALCPSTIKHRTILLITVILRLLSIKCAIQQAMRGSGFYTSC